MADKKVQPKSPQHEGVDPLADGEKLYPRTDGRAESNKSDEKADTASEKKTAQTVEDQNEVNAKANTPDDLLPDSPEEQPPADNDHVAEDAEKFPESDTPKGKASGSKTSSR